MAKPVPLLTDDENRLAGKLEKATESALDRLTTIVETDIDRDDESFAALQRNQVAASTALLTAQLRVDEQKLQRRRDERAFLDDLDARIKAALADNPALLRLP